MTARLWGMAAAFAGLGALVFTALIDFSGSFVPYGIMCVAYVIAGGILIWRLGSHVVAWYTLGVGWSGVGLFIVALGTSAKNLTLAGWLDASGNAIATVCILFIPALLLRFPDGELMSRRWRPTEWILVLTGVSGATASMLNSGWGGDTGQANVLSPLYESTRPLGDVSSSIFYSLLAVVFVVAGLSLIFRYRGSTGVRRLQIKWLAYAGGLLMSTFVLMLLVSGATTADEPWQQVLLVVGFFAIPAAIGISVLQYRLYDIDVVINRTVVLTVLAVFITGVYAIVVVFIGGLIGSESEGLFLPIVATAFVAVAFEPVRHTAQRWANRLVYGRRATPYEVLSDLTSRLSQGEQGEGLLSRMAQRLGDGTGAERATIWLGRERSMRVGASWPEGPRAGHAPDLDSAHVFLVTHDGSIVGAFEVVKPRGTALSTAERSLITDLAGSAGALLGYQRLNDSLAEKAEELARSRSRLVDAQDRERRRLERDLHDGAQQSIVALKVKIGLARTMAVNHGATKLEALLAGLSDEAQGALDEVRALAKGIYPPVLESDGLGPAISALAAGAAEDVLIDLDGIDRYERDVEATIYFEISEAMTNAIKHACGPIRVDVAELDGELRFSVSDSGPGFDVATANGGSGLQNLRDRVDAVGGTLEIVSSPGRGTTVRGRVPLEVVPA
jgi:signal transduction histidine kinase